MADQNSAADTRFEIRTGSLVVAADAVQGILWYRTGRPRSEVRNVTVRTVSGVVELEGYAATERGRAAIEALVRQVAGVLGVGNGLHTFEVLPEAVQATEHRGNLGRDRRGSDLGS